MSRPAGSRDRFEDYVPVAERLEKFYERFPDGRITTSIVEHNLESGFVLMRAEVYRSPDDAAPAATGHAFEVRGESYVNKTSYIENAETSSVGRALAMLGFEVKRGIASREELQKTTRMQTATPQASAPTKAQAKATTAPAPAQSPVDLDREILEAAEALGYDAAKVRKWVNQKFKVTDGLDTLSPQDKREVLKIFRERASA
jgi:Holliday junction resolvasome RuvABC DNA-binding subunit